MNVEDAMTTHVVTIGPASTLRSASQTMASRGIGSVVVHDADQPGPGIITERDIVAAVASGVDLDDEVAGSFVTRDAAYAAPTWSLLDATEAMRVGGFRHLVVVDGTQVLGIVSLRDVVSAWSRSGLPAHTP